MDAPTAAEVAVVRHVHVDAGLPVEARDTICQGELILHKAPRGGWSLVPRGHILRAHREREELAEIAGERIILRPIVSAGYHLELFLGKLDALALGYLEYLLGCLCGHQLRPGFLAQAFKCALIYDRAPLPLS